MIDQEMALLLTGAAIALVSAIVTALVQDFLSVKADRAKRERGIGGRKRDNGSYVTSERDNPPRPVSSRRAKAVSVGRLLQ